MHPTDTLAVKTKVHGRAGRRHGRRAARTCRDQAEKSASVIRFIGLIKFSCIGVAVNWAKPWHFNCVTPVWHTSSGHCSSTERPFSAGAHAALGGHVVRRRCPAPQGALFCGCGRTDPAFVSLETQGVDRLPIWPTQHRHPLVTSALASSRMFQHETADSVVPRRRLRGLPTAGLPRRHASCNEVFALKYLPVPSWRWPAILFERTRHANR